MVRVDARTPWALPVPAVLAAISEDGRLRASGMHDPAVQTTSHDPAAPVHGGAVHAAAEPAVTVLLRPSLDAAFDFLRDGAAGLSRHLRLEGDVMLAGALGEIARHLRWDAVEDLSRVTGDVAAERIARTARSGVMAARDAGARLRAGASRYLAGESGGRLLERDALSIFEARIDDLERRVAVLPSRMPGSR